MTPWITTKDPSGNIWWITSTVEDSLGVIPVRYGDGLMDRIREIAPEGVDAALDAAGDEALMASIQLVPDHRRIRTMLADDLAAKLGIPALEGVRTTDRLQELVDLYNEGLITIHLRKTFPLESAGEAHRLVETRHGRGKVILTL